MSLEEVFKLAGSVPLVQKHSDHIEVVRGPSQIEEEVLLVNVRDREVKTYLRERKETNLNKTIQKQQKKLNVLIPPQLIEMQ